MKKLLASLLLVLCVSAHAAENMGAIPVGATIPCTFNTFGSSGESLTMSGLAVTDVEIYKNGSTTQRSSDAGYALIDTDGIDIDGQTGYHGFTIDTSDNTDSGFYAAGSFYDVNVNSITVNSQTVAFTACKFRLVAAENTAGTPVADAVRISGDSGAADALETMFDGTAGPVAPAGIVDQGTAQSATGTTLVLRAALAMGDDTANGMTLMACGSTQGYCQSRTVTDYVSSTDTATVDAWTVTPSGTITYYLYATAPGSGGSGATAQQVWEYATRTLTALDEDSTTIDLNASAVGSVAGNVTGSVGSIASGGISASSFAAGAIDAAAIAADAIGASEIAANAIGASEIAADAVGASELASDAASEVATATLTAAESAPIAADAQEMNGVEILGAGTSSDKWRGE